MGATAQILPDEFGVVKERRGFFSEVACWIAYCAKIELPSRLLGGGFSFVV